MSRVFVAIALWAAAGAVLAPGTALALNPYCQESSPGVLGSTSWTNVNGGTFDDSANWSNGRPSPNCSAFVTLPGTYTISVEATAAMDTAGGVTAADLHLGASSGVQTIAVVANSINGNADLNLYGGTITANGRITLDSTNPNGAAALHVGNGLTNAGTITTLPGAGGTRTLYRSITNTGTIDIDTDTTGSPGNASNLNLTNNGTLNIATGKTFILGNTFSQASGTTNVGGALTTADSFSVTGGTFTGNPPILSAGTLTAPAGSGTFKVPGGVFLTGDVGPAITLIVEANGADARLSGPSTAWTNMGTIQLTGTVGDAALDAVGGLTNRGTIETLPGGGGTRTLRRSITNAATLDIGADTTGAPGNASNLHLTNTGTLNIPAGKTFTLGNDFSQSGGLLNVDGTLASDSAIPIVGGVVRGTGTLVGAVSNTGGVVHPGHSPGVLSITGSYNQGSGGALAIDVAGPSAGSGFSQLAVSGAATLGGTLAVSTSVPQTATLRILTAKAVTGTFSPVTFTGQTDTVAYDATGVQLTATAPPPPPGGQNPPVISRLSVTGLAHSPKRTFRFTLSKAAKVKIAFARRRAGRRKGSRCVAPTRTLAHAKRCSFYASVGKLSVTGRAGANKVVFSGKIGSNRLKPGRYRATLTATDSAGRTSKAKTRYFTVLKK